MFNMKNLMTRALLALALSFGAGAAMAGPTYHITIDTADYAGTQGYLDLSLVALGDAAPAFAMLDNFTGNFAGSSALEGSASGDVSTGILLGNRDLINAFTALVDFGGLFSFDIRFDLDDGKVGSTFSVALINDAFDGYLGSPGSLLDVALLPGEAPAFVANSSLVAAAEVPEPATLASLVLGLALMGSMLRARRKQ
jgi:hypothetical protein